MDVIAYVLMACGPQDTVRFMLGLSLRRASCRAQRLALRAIRRSFKVSVCQTTAHSSGSVNLPLCEQDVRCVVPLKELLHTVQVCEQASQQASSEQEADEEMSSDSLKVRACSLLPRFEPG